MRTNTALDSASALAMFGMAKRSGGRSVTPSDTGDFASLSHFPIRNRSDLLGAVLLGSNMASVTKTMTNPPHQAHQQIIRRSLKTTHPW